jgi:hypothetical protein
LIVDISITKRVLFGLGKAMDRVAIPRYYDKNEQDGDDVAPFHDVINIAKPFLLVHIR